MKKWDFIFSVVVFIYQGFIEEYQSSTPALFDPCIPLRLG